MIKDEYGDLHRFQETIDLIESATIEAHSTSRREYEESHLDATMAMHRAVGFIKMAEELEPYNPQVLWKKAFITEMSGKSTMYMVELSEDAIAKCELCEDYGYKKPNQNLKIMKFATKEYKRDVEKGIVYQGNVK